jgi:hypothetical protein
MHARIESRCAENASIVWAPLIRLKAITDFPELPREFKIGA